MFSVAVFWYLMMPAPLEHFEPAMGLFSVERLRGRGNIKEIRRKPFKPLFLPFPPPTPFSPDGGLRNLRSEHGLLRRLLRARL